VLRALDAGGEERSAVVKSTVRRAIKAGRISGTKDEQGEWPLVRAGDGPQQRLEPIHVLADMRIEVAQPDAARRYALRANLLFELGVRADGDDRVMQGLQDRCGRLGRGQEDQVAFW
jgi:hypothetical protein